jgi:hypothetical protein
MVIVWASFSGALRRSNLVVIERDKESPNVSDPVNRGTSTAQGTRKPVRLVVY